MSEEIVVRTQEHHGHGGEHHGIRHPEKYADLNQQKFDLSPFRQEPVSFRQRIESAAIFVGISLILCLFLYAGLERFISERFAANTLRWVLIIGVVALFAGLVIAVCGFLTKGITWIKGLWLFSKYSAAKKALEIEAIRSGIGKSEYIVARADVGLVLNTRTGNTSFFAARQQPSENHQTVIPENTSVINALDILARCDSVLIAGGKGAGKTNLAFHLAECQARAGCQVFVIDPKPHFETGKWQGSTVIGTNHNYSEITAFLSELTAVMKDDRAQVRIWIDELTVLNMRIKKFATLWLPVLIEGREYGKFISIIGQSKTAGSVGLEGRYDLLDCFDAIAVCRHNKASGERFTEIEMAGEPMLIGNAPERFGRIGYHGSHESRLSPHKSSGDFRTCARGDSRDCGDTRVICHEPGMGEYVHSGKPRRFFESRAEKQAVEMSEAGKSLSKIAAVIFGAKSGARVRTIKAWIDKHCLTEEGV